MDLSMASTTITLGNGGTTLFWHVKWCTEGPPKVLCVEPFHHRIKEAKKGNEGVLGQNWIKSIVRRNNLAHLIEFINLWNIVSWTNLQHTTKDTIVWKWTRLTLRHRPT
jgi:hypothetical protein